MKSVLITGGCGYIGSFLCYKFLSNNFKVYVIDNNHNGKVFIKHKNIKYFKFNFCNKKTINIINKYKIEDVFHLAAYIDSAESVSKPDKYIKNNYYLTKKLLMSFPNSGIKRIFFASTAAVYNGKNKKRISEQSKKVPESPYGKSKLLSEKFIIKKFDKSNINYVILRLFNVAGANPKILLGPYNSNYNHIFNKLIRNKKFKIYGNNYKTPDGSAVRDYVHPDDVAQAFFKSYNFLIKNRKNEIFNCGSGKPFSVKKVVDNFVKFSRNKIEVSVAKRRPGDPAYTLSNNNKIKRKLKIKFKKSNLKNIISDLVLWRSSLSKKLGQKSKMISIKYKSNL